MAAGASTAYLGHDDWAARAPSLKALADARRVRSRMLGAFERAELTGDPSWMTFAVAGGGPTGVELAGQIAEPARRTLRRDFAAVDTTSARVTPIEAVRRSSPRIPSRSASERRAPRPAGSERPHGCAGDGVDPQGVEVAARHVPARTVLWAAGVAASPLAAALAKGAGLEPDAAGRLPVAPDLSLPGHPEVLALGDMVALDGVPGIAPAAMQQGRYAARTIRRRLAGKTPAAPFRYRDKGTLAVIARGRAVGVAAGIRFSGALAFLVWAVVHVRYLVGWGNRLVTVVRWTWSLLARNQGERVIDAPAAVRPRALTGTSA